MTAEDIQKYLIELNDELCQTNTKGEICLYGGAVMCVAFKARPVTKDIDAVFAPVKEIRRAAGKIADKYDLPKDWLNFAVKMFVVEHQKKIWFDLPCLKVYVPETDYLLAMKLLAARADTFDLDDAEFLIRDLKLQSIGQALDVVKNYYPNKQVKPETVFALEEMFSSR